MDFNFYIILLLLSLILLVFSIFSKSQQGKIKSQDLQNLQQTLEEMQRENLQKLEEYKNQINEKNEKSTQFLKNKYENLLKNAGEITKENGLEEVNSLKKQVLNLKNQMLDLQLEYEKKEEELKKKEESLEKDRLKLEQEWGEKNKEILQKMEQISGLSQEEVKKNLIKEVEEKIGLDLLNYQKKALINIRQNINLEARQIVSMAIQRCSSEVANEATVTVIKLKNNEDKGKIIGKNGRNIMWLEKTLGVEVIIDETPDIVTISGFNSIRRHVAKKTLELLLEDGRLHPSAIEEMHEKAREQISQEIIDAGHEAVESLGIVDFPEKLIRILGRLKFRTSYGQNILKHSVEMARLASTLCDEINMKFSHRTPLDRMICIKGALLHDIGKAIDEETQPKGDHVKLGAKVADIFNLDWRIKKCITAHHDESYEDEKNGVAVEAIIVDACDNISGSRPGARKESLEFYYQRLEAMEEIAEKTEGVQKAWIMRGARELWVFFDTKKVGPKKVQLLTKEIAEKIELSVIYPSEIKVIGMWENRVVEYAL